jgi:hypothetical protein
MENRMIQRQETRQQFEKSGANLFVGNIGAVLNITATISVNYS